MQAHLVSLGLCELAGMGNLLPVLLWKRPVAGLHRQGVLQHMFMLRLARASATDSSKSS